MQLTYKGFTIDVRAHAFDGGFTALVVKDDQLYDATGGPSEVEAAASAKSLVDALLSDYSHFPLDADGHLTIESSDTSAGTRAPLTLRNNGQTQLIIYNTAASVYWFLAANTDDSLIFSRTGSGVAEARLTADGDLEVRGEVLAGDDEDNQLTARGSATGSPAELEATGSDTDIDLQLTPKGAGLVRFGISADPGKAMDAPDRYVTIKAADGTTFYVFGSETDPSA